ncbi:MAG: HesA/MoeB/ThiF family protein [Pseudomonadota bacterium]
MLNDETLLRYSRHLLLDEWAESHQQRLANSHVLVVGMGGLGCAVAPYLVSSGVGTITLVDFDTVSLDNLQRQVLYRQSNIGLHKVSAAAANLAMINPEVTIKPQAVRWSEAECEHYLLTEDVNLVIDCSDNFDTRYALNRICLKHKLPLVSGAAVEWEGRLMVFDFRQADSPCYHCVFPEGDDIQERRCATTGIFAPLVGIVGAMQAGEALKVLAGVGKASTHTLFSLNVASNQWRTSRFQADSECQVCATQLLKTKKLVPL